MVRGEGRKDEKRRTAKDGLLWAGTVIVRRDREKRRFPPRGSAPGCGLRRCSEEERRETGGEARGEAG